jgi:hypothetical protein
MVQAVLAHGGVVTSGILRRFVGATFLTTCR